MLVPTRKKEGRHGQIRKNREEGGIGSGQDSVVTPDVEGS
jgi:hypothetical protein